MERYSRSPESSFAEAIRTLNHAVAITNVKVIDTATITKFVFLVNSKRYQ